MIPHPHNPHNTNTRELQLAKKTESLSALAIAISNWLYYPKGKKSVERWNLVVSSLASCLGSKNAKDKHETLTSF